MSPTDIHWLEWLTNPAGRTFWGFWLSSLVIALSWALLDWPSRSALLRQWLSKAYWLHPSARQDYWLIALNTLLFTLLGFSTLLWVIEIANISYQQLNKLAPPALLAPTSGWLIAVYAVLLLLLDDASRYGLHRLLHSRWLWPLHRLHHSATILTPLTFLRLHPLEQLLYQCRSVLVHGTMSGSYFFLTQTTPELWLIFGVSGFVWLFNMFGANLRHSQIPLHYGWLEHLLISPAQHQQHHAIGGLRCNYGSMLAIWDKSFGSWRSGRQVLPLPATTHSLIAQLFLKTPKSHHHD